MLFHLLMFTVSTILSTTNPSGFYQLELDKVDGSTFEFQSLKGKVVLVVNTASGCGFAPQYGELQKLYNEYHASGLEILAFPSADFGGQEPLSNKQILVSCSSDYGVSFPVFAKSKVRGHGANPVFIWLSSPDAGRVTFSKPIWNFQKFLINKEGKLVKVYLPFVSPSSARLKKAIAELLRQ